MQGTFPHAQGYLADSHARTRCLPASRDVVIALDQLPTPPLGIGDKALCFLVAHGPLAPGNRGELVVTLFQPCVAPCPGLRAAELGRCLKIAHRDQARDEGTLGIEVPDNKYFPFLHHIPEEVILVRVERRWVRLCGVCGHGDPPFREGARQRLGTAFFLIGESSCNGRKERETHIVCTSEAKQCGA